MDAAHLPQTMKPARFPRGSYTVTGAGSILVSTLPASFPRVFMEVIGKVMLGALSSSRELGIPLAELSVDYAGLEICARDLSGGAIIFISPREY